MVSRVHTHTFFGACFDRHGSLLSAHIQSADCDQVLCPGLQAAQDGRALPTVQHQRADVSVRERSELHRVPADLGWLQRTPADTDLVRARL